jgi:hypothetical protein
MTWRSSISTPLSTQKACISSIKSENSRFDILLVDEPSITTPPSMPAAILAYRFSAAVKICFQSSG